MGNTDKQVKFTLLENAFDFILSALAHISDDSSERDLKYAILHLSAGVELVLKERLKKEHWSLVFENVEKANRQSYESGEFQSVNVITCIDRLNGICGLSFRPEHKEALTHLRKKRNKLEHFSTVDSVDAMKSATGKVLSIILDFIVRNLSPKKFDVSEQKMFDEIKSQVMKLEDFAKHRMETLKGELEEKGKACHVLECPSCLEEALVLGDGNPQCLFCYYEDTPDKVAHEYLETIQGESRYLAVKEGGPYSLYYCFSCGDEALVHLVNDGVEGKTEWVCFGCGESWANDDIDFCGRCGVPYPDKHGSAMCGGCYDSLVGGD